MRNAPSIVISLSVSVSIAWAVTAAGVASAAGAAPTAADLARVEADIGRIQQELREQRALILQMMEMHAALLRYLQAGGGSAGQGSLPAMPALPGAPAATPAPAATAVAAAPVATTTAEAREPAGHGTAGGNSGTVSGSVHLKSGVIGDAFVYVDGPRVAASHPGTIEIKQRSKQFSPSVAVVQAGTRVLFPNEDKIFHNVFSPTPGDSFDLGTLKSGDKPAPVVLSKPGHVEVFCNIHSKMRADVLVVPNAHWTRVRADGTFQIAGVPVGARHVVLWGPGLKAVSQKLEVTPAGAIAAFSTEASGPPRHLNKTGGEYGSYED